ncbi:MAG TPA: hypothetical protein VIV12_29505 [Streptosporangiaceae bacterium]
MSWGDAFTGAGVLIALAALLYTHKVSRRQTNLAQQQTDVQARLTAIEEARRADEVDARRRARVVPAFWRPESNRLRLVLTNEGPAPAREVGCDLAPLDGRQLPRVMGLEALPVELRPGQPMEFLATAGLGMSTLIRAVVTWVDDVGEQEESFTLNTL